MKTTVVWVACAALFVSSATMTGCETQAQSGLGGAALGAGIGAIIGNQSGNAAEGAIIGGVIGGLAGLVVHDIKSERRKNAQQTAETYHYESSQGMRLTFEQAWVRPNAARRGTLVEASSQYAVLGAGSGVPVTETWFLQRNGETISQLTSYTQTRNDGTWVSTLPFQIPGNFARGEYAVVHAAKTDRSSFSGGATFVVE